MGQLYQLTPAAKGLSCHVSSVAGLMVARASIQQIPRFFVPAPHDCHSGMSLCAQSRCVNGKGVIVYPNPLVADLMASGIANKIAFLHDHRVEASAELLRALARLESEMDQFADAVWASAEFLEGRSPGAALSAQCSVHRNTTSNDAVRERVAGL